MSVKFPVNLSKKKRGVRVQPNLTVEDLELLEREVLTKRKVLGFVNGFGDVLGIAQPWYMKLKMMMKRFHEGEISLGWDDEVLGEQRRAWLDVMTEALVQGSMVFPRSTRPQNSSGEGPSVDGLAEGALQVLGLSFPGLYCVQS